MMNLPYSEELHIENLSRLFDNTSECYKFFWFKAIVEKVIAGETEISFEELVDDMIASAWYMVTEFHLNLGPKDTLESVVKLIKDKNPHFKSSIKKSKLLAYLSETKDKEYFGNYDGYRAKRNNFQKTNFNIECTISSAGAICAGDKGKSMGCTKGCID